MVAHKGTKVGGNINSQSDRSAFRDTDIHLDFGHVYLVTTEVLEFLNGCVGLNYSRIFFYP